MKLEIVTPDKKIFEGQADGVQLPGANGSFEVLNNHAPIVAALVQGTVKVTQGKSTESYNISGGLVEMQKNTLIVLAESIVA